MAIHASAVVHPHAFVEEGARIGAGCQIGPFCTVGSDVSLAGGVVLKSHAVVTGRTEIGPETEIFPFAVIGEVPQDLKFDGELTDLIVGARNRIREGATMNVGTKGGGGVTRVGDDGLFMTGSHVGHDAHVGDRVVMANQSALAGHCIVGNNVVIGGLSGVHQFVRIGDGAIIGAVCMVTNDVIPNGMVMGPRGELHGLNLIGLKRRGVGREEISELRKAFELLKTAPGTFHDRAETLADQSDSDHVKEIMTFILEGSDRSFLTPV